MTPCRLWSTPSKRLRDKVTPQQVESHDPTKASGKGLAQKWVELFNETRKRFQTEISDIPIANKAYRLRALDRMMTNAEKMRNMALAASLMEQAAKEVGDAYSNKQKVEHTSPDGSMTPKPTIIQLLPVEPKA